MNARTIPIVSDGAIRQRKREAPKGRGVDPVALSDILIGLPTLRYLPRVG